MARIRMMVFMVIASFVLAGNMHASTIQLTQGGWTFGGPLILSLTGQDENLDGRIDQPELSAFQASYRLPQGGMTTWSLSDLHSDGFQFSDTGNFLFFTSNADYSLIDSALHTQVTASVINRFLFPIDVTDSLPVVVPEPSGLIWSGIALLAVRAAPNLRSRGLLRP